MADIRHKGPAVEEMAGTPIVAFRAIAVVGSLAVFADKDVPSHALCLQGISMGAALSGTKAKIQVYGPMVGPWDWTKDVPLYVGSNGTLTDVMPTTGWIREIARTKDTNRIFIDIQPLNSTQDKHYFHSQNTPLDTWVIDHMLGKIPSITITDSAGVERKGAVSYPSLNQAVVSLGGAMSGRAYCN